MKRKLLSRVAQQRKMKLAQLMIFIQTPSPIILLNLLQDLYSTPSGDLADSWAFGLLIRFK